MEIFFQHPLKPGNAEKSDITDVLYPALQLPTFPETVQSIYGLKIAKLSNG